MGPAACGSSWLTLEGPQSLGPGFRAMLRPMGALGWETDTSSNQNSLNVYLMEQLCLGWEKGREGGPEHWNNLRIASLPEN